MASNTNPFSDAEIKGEEWERVRISNAATRPNQKSAYGSGLDAGGTKALFDAPLDLLRERHNKMVDYAREEEGARASAELERENAEKARKIEEGSIASQSGRAWAEQLRSKHEDERVSDEITRQRNETEREKNERQRNADELKREENEAARVEAEERRNTLVGDLDAALDAIIAIQESLIGGGA